MSDDERAIREFVATWHRATASCDLPQLLALMAEDVVFLVAGQPPMRGRKDPQCDAPATLSRFCANSQMGHGSSSATPTC
jgi:ketosteroid isomerase-like protein